MPIVNSTPPPARGSSSQSNAKPTATVKVPKSRKDRTEAVAALGQLAQVPLMATKQFADAGAVSAYWPSVSEEIAKLAETQPAIANIIDPLMQVGPYAGLIAAVLPFVMQIGVNHGRLAAGAMGTVPADTLSAQIEAGLAKQQLEALKVQAAAEAEANAVRAEIANERKAWEANNAAA
jgi:hypothetical protein